MQGAGLSWLLQARRLPYADILLLMIALSDNHCTNLVIRRIGIERLNQLFQAELGLADTRLERKLMDYAARARGLDNWISAQDAIRLFAARAALTDAERAWIEPLFLACVDGGLWLRNVPRDTVAFYHKTGSMTGVLHDWGLIGAFQIFESAYIMTGGGPSYATYFFGLNIYFTAFQSLRFAYASTLAWMLFAIIAALTIVVFSTSRRWVFYAGAREDA